MDDLDADTFIYKAYSTIATFLDESKKIDLSQIDPLYDFNHQSVEIDKLERIRVATSVHGKMLIEYCDNDVRTMYDVLRKGMELSNNGPCLGTRNENGKGVYKWAPYSEVIDRVKYTGSGLMYKGVKAGNLTNIGIYAKNRAEWVISEHACYYFSLNVVSLYESYGEESIEFILNQAEISTLFTDNFERLKNIFAIIQKLPFLKLVIHFDELTKDQKISLDIPEHVELVYFYELMDIGRENPLTPFPPKPSDIATICYTSGTTGTPKGAIITHGNLISNEAAMRNALHKPHLKIPGATRNNPSSVWVSYLPLAHMFERMMNLKCFLEGGQIGYYSGDLKNLSDDCKELKPTNIAMIPIILNRLYDSVQNEIADSSVKSFLLKKAIESKEEDRRKGIIERNTLYDKLVLNKIRDQFGGNVIRIITGNAPLTTEVMKFSRSVFGCAVPEGYGQTEATFAITLCHLLDPELGHVGPPVESVMVKLVDIPEMGYFSREGNGEICTKGPSIFKGYYKEPEKTAEVIDKEGWLHTGDVGMWLPNGCLKIIDRVKHIFKLSQGEYIAPERIERIYSRSPLIAQIFVDGDSLKNFLIAVIVPDEEHLLDFCKKNNIEGDFKELCRNSTIKELIFKVLSEIADKSDLMSYEKVKNIHLHNELFSFENGLTTPTLKIKRNDLKAYFKDIVSSLYEEGEFKI